VDNYLLLYVIAAVAIFAFLQGVFLFIDASGDIAARTKRRLDSLSINEPAEVLRRKALGEGASPWLVTLLASSPVRWFDNLITTSGINKTTERVLVVMTFGVSAGAILLKLVVGLGLLLSLFGSFAVAVMLPLVLLLSMRTRRARRIAEQLPEALDMFVRSLRAGHPIPTAIRMIATEMPAPIGAEFAMVFDTMAYGLDLRDALQRMTRRVPVPEVQYMVGAIRIQHAAGGNLAEILGSLSSIMRDRLKLYLKVKALSAESRLSGKVLACIPFLIVTVIIFTNPDFYDGARTDNRLAMLLYFAAFLVLFGIVLVRRVVNIRV
jgi:tight adherence protein B